MRAAPALLLLCAAAAQAAPSRGPYLVAASSVSATACWRLGGAEPCVELAGAPGSSFTYAVPLTTITVTGRFLPPPGRPLRFAAFGDMGTGSRAQWRVAEQLERWEPDLVVALGDIVYPAGADEDYDEKYFRPYARLLPRVPFFPAIGNHDYGNSSRLERGRRGLEAYRRIHRRPAYYSFTAGPVHFAVIDTNQAYGIAAAEPFEPGSPQWLWLDADLADATAPWKVVLTHIQLYSSMRHGDQDALRAALLPLLRRREVDLVLQGHAHIYERSRPLQGIVFVTAGTGGAGLHRGNPRLDWLESYERAHGFVGIEADEKRLKLSFVDADGAVRDSATFEK